MKLTESQLRAWLDQVTAGEISFSGMVELINEHKNAGDESFSASQSLWRILQRKQNNHPEIFTDLDRERIKYCKEVIDKNAPPFDPKHVLRRS